MIKNIKTAYFNIFINDNGVSLVDLNDNVTILTREDVDELRRALGASLHPQDFFPIVPRYDYKGADELFRLYTNFFVDPWECGDYEAQKARREFLRAFTRHNSDRQMYIDYARDWLENYLPSPEAKSKCYDFKEIKEAERIIELLETF